MNARKQKIFSTDPITSKLEQHFYNTVLEFIKNRTLIKKIVIYLKVNNTRTIIHKRIPLRILKKVL